MTERLRQPPVDDGKIIDGVFTILPTTTRNRIKDAGRTSVKRTVEVVYTNDNFLRSVTLLCFGIFAYNSLVVRDPETTVSPLILPYLLRLIRYATLYKLDGSGAIKYKYKK